MAALDIEFIGSFPGVAKAPHESLPEFAFVGRSNVGKSSLINMLAERKGLAHTSASPGKTQLLNFYRVDARWILVDLPGYGYAKISKKHRSSLRKMILSYLGERQTLFCAMVLLDARLPLQQLDRDMIAWLGERSIPQGWVFTKVDKGRGRETSAQVKATLATLSELWEELPPVFETSAETGSGREGLLQFISESLRPARTT